MWQDVKYGMRMLGKAPGFTVVAVLTLALGIGANTAIFSLLDAVLIRSLPYRNPGQLVYVWIPSHNLPHVPIDAIGPSNGDFFDIQRQARSFSSISLFNPQSFNLATEGATQRVNGALIRANFLSTLGVSPLLGHGIQKGDTEPGDQRVVVISYGLWQSAFGGSAQVLGKTVTLDRNVYRIVGVMPASFGYPSGNELPYSSPGQTQVWVPMVLTPKEKADRDNSTSDAIARLKPGVTLAQAQAELNTIMPRLNLLHNQQIFGGWYAALRPFTETVLGRVRLLVWLLFGAVCLVLLIACANAANLLLARAAGRAHEMGVRSALGARRWRLIRQILTEALMLACAGGALGMLIAYAAIRLLLRLNPGNIPRLGQTSLDLRVLLFTVAISILTGIVFGILPALGVSRTNLSELLKQGGNRATTAGASKRWRHGLIIGEVALAVVLLTGSGLLIRSYVNLESVATGFYDSTLTLQIALDARYSKPEQRRDFYQSVMEKLGALHGVSAIGATDDLPLSGSEEMSEFTVEGYANQKHQLVDSRDVTANYFEAMGTTLLSGRFFTSQDDAADAAGVVIVNEAFAKAYFHGRSTVGGHFCLCYFVSGSPSWSTVVGVVGNVRHDNLENTPPPQVYLPFFRNGQAPDRAYIAIRTSVPPEQIIRAIRSTVREIDPNLAVANIATMDQRVSQASALRRFQTSLFGVFAGVALFLAAIGLYGLMAYSVKLRTNEIGIRLALGAQKSHVWKLIIGQGMTLTLAGIVVGVCGALALVRLLSSLLYGVAPIDPATFIVVVVVLVGVSLLACYVPARRAMKVEPMEALRYE